jgi:hypothetical protein
MYADHFMADTKGFIQLLQYCQLYEVVDQRLRHCVDQLVRQYPSGITAEYVMTMLGNRPELPPQVERTGIDPIEVRSMQNLLEMSMMMELN